MKNIWRIELKKLHSKSIYLFLALFCLFTVLDNILFYKFDATKPDLIVGNFGISLFLTQLYLIYLASTYITSDFTLGTSTTMFTGVYSRIQVINAKTFFLLLISSVLAILNVAIGSIIQLNVYATLDVSIVFVDAIKLVFVYGLYFFSILSFSVFISSLLLNRLYTIIMNYLAFIFIGELAAQATDRGSTALKNVMESFPFYLATDGFNQLQYSLYSILILVAFSVTLYGAGVFVFQKRDLL